MRQIEEIIETARQCEEAFTSTLAEYGASDPRVSAAFREMVIADAKAIKAYEEANDQRLGIIQLTRALWPVSARLATPAENAESMAAMRRTFSTMAAS